MAQENLSLGEVLLQEYERLKQEQTQRIATRDSLIYATLLSLAGVIAAALQATSPGMLLLLPPVCVILGWTYLVNDEKVSAIGRYIHTNLAVRLEAMVGEPVFGWETAHRADRYRVSRKVGQAIADLMIFVAPAVAALVTFWMTASPGRLLLLVSGAELVVAALLAVQIIMYADLARAQPELPPMPAPQEDRPHEPAVH